MPGLTIAGLRGARAARLVFLVLMAFAAPAAINVKDLGCVGDGKHDDTACFMAATRTLQSRAIVNNADNGGANHLGQASIHVPAGIYLITAPEALMASSFTARTTGYTIEGEGSGTTMIEYRPTTAGALMHNNDAWLNVLIQNIAFNAASPAAAFLDSYSTGGAQDYHFANVAWVGTWGNIVNLSGGNSNSEWDWDHVTFSGTFSNVLYIGPTGTSDQFLNFWFRNSKIWIYHGNFINASKGGHFKISDCDFSGLEGSGDPAKPDILFGLHGHSHASGVTYFDCRNSRFELKSPSVKVLQSEWGNNGEIAFEDDDFSSQRSRVDPVNEFTIDLSHAGGAPQYNFVRSQLMGFVSIQLSNDDWGYRRNVTFEDVQFVSFDDYAEGIRFGEMPPGSNYGGIPVVTCTRCRGQDNSIYTLDHWKPGSEYDRGHRVFSNGYVYAAQVSGRTGATAPQGRKQGLVDGGVVWNTVDLYYGSDYVQDGQIRPAANFPNGSAGPLRTAFLSDPTNFNKLPRTFSRLILPPYAVVIDLKIAVTASPKNPGVPLKYVVRSDELQPRTLLTISVPSPRTGYLLDQQLDTPFIAGSGIASRTIILEAAEDVAEGSTGFFAVTYY